MSIDHVIVCGGRNYADRGAVFRELDAVDATQRIGVLVNGGATGADSLAREWALARGRNTVTVYADWKKHGRAAGPIRNKQMLDLHDPRLVVAFPGGKGTANMVSQALAAGVEVLHVSDERATERTRQYRERLEKGILAARVDLSPEALEAIIKSGALKSEATDDPRAVREAVTTFLNKLVTTFHRTTTSRVIHSSST